MPKILEVRGDFKIMMTKRDFIVVNTSKAYENHAHFKDLSALNHLITLIERGIMPTSPYFSKAAQRLLGNEFENLRKPRKKSPYYNQKYLPKKYS